MSKTIQQQIIFKNTAPNDLYDLYMNQKKHAAVIGGEVKISNKEGTAFSAYGDYCYGENIHLRKGVLIVQSWRASDWDKSDPDSTFILHFDQKGKDTVVTMLHVNVPDSEAKALKNGWKEFYWTPWRNYLSGKKPEKMEGM